MARLRVVVRPSAGVGGYSLFVDGVPADMDRRHRGEVVCTGRCGDGSIHALLYSFTGAAGSSLSITLRCAANIVCRLRSEPVAESGMLWKAGREMFAI
jgi:hypothetical protein